MDCYGLLWQARGNLVVRHTPIYGFCWALEGEGMHERSRHASHFITRSRKRVASSSIVRDKEVRLNKVEASAQ
jgi:hypothetical protein